ncbi:Sugar transporter ERD6-like 7 [Linum perenne]
MTNKNREPLIRHNLAAAAASADQEHGHIDHHDDDESLSMVYLSTFVAVCGSYEFGCCVGFSSPTQDAIRADLSLSLAQVFCLQYSVFGSILTFGAMIGAATSGPLADFLGRKGAMRLSAAFCVLGWLAIYFAQGAVALDIGRLATGYGMGVFSYVVPVFISEMAPKNLRGALATLNQVMIGGGVSGSFILGTFITWRSLALTGLVPCAVLIFGLTLIPESPRWLAKTGHEKEFEVALQKLRGKDSNISREAAEIQEYIETLDRLPQATLLDLFHARYLRSVIIGVGLMVVQQFGGINAVCFYASNILKSAGVSSSFGIIIYAVVQVSASGLVVACLLISLSFYLRTNHLALEYVPLLAITGILLYVGSFSAGMGAVPWVIMSEIFPINIKGVAGGLATLVNWFGAWAVSYTYNFLNSWSSYGTFLVYAAINAVAIVFVAKVVPETKGRTLEQIQAAING